ncbi:MAG: helix-turn-helix domain-containing protein [Chloroflexi bacterium]|nr:helix-turn-helix domain-containing protein [Chloroflexota bacterium]MDA1228426.1 helix-turn-helix domain-containing protein [Chloroflexota bacterium]
MLTPTEFKLLYLLAKNRHMTLSQEFIQRVIWADDIEAGDTLKKYVQRLRRKLGDDARNPIWIKTVHGVGYRFSSPTPIPTEPTSAGAIH